MSVIARRTVSILPASTSERRVSRSRRPVACVVSNSCSSLASGQFGLGFLYSGELFFRRLGDEVVSAVEAEVGDKEHIDTERNERCPDVHDKARDTTGFPYQTRFSGSAGSGRPSAGRSR